ncbi:MAG: Ig-like domain-containing protein [Terracidiphilus sp.]
MRTMHNKMAAVAICIAAFAMGASAQTLTVATSLSPSTYGTSVSFTATITNGPADPLTFTFYDGTTSLGNVTITSGTTATLTTSTLVGGSHTITAYWAGGGGVTSSPITQVVSSLPTLTLTSLPPSSSTLGQSVTFTATISSGPTSAPNIYFYDGATSLGNVAISGNQAIFATTALSAGVHTITASWAGNSSYDAVTSSAITQVVSSSTSSTGVVGTIPMFIGTTNTLGNSAIAQSSGMIGIGTTAPDEVLTVSGNAHITGQVYSNETVVNPLAGPGWYRLVKAVNLSGGTIYVKAWENNALQELDFNYDVKSYAGGTATIGDVNVLRTLYYNGGPISQIRINSDNINDHYVFLDVYVNQVTSSTSQPFAVYGTEGVVFVTSTMPPGSTITSTVAATDTGDYSKSIDLTTTGYRGILTTDEISTGVGVILNSNTSATDNNNTVVNVNSPSLIAQGSYWNPALNPPGASVDAWTVNSVLGAGTNPTSTLTFSHSGSTGAPSLSVGGSINATGLNLTAGSGGSITFHDGTTQTTAYNPAGTASNVVLTQSGGNVAIGTTSTVYPLNVVTTGAYTSLFQNSSAATSPANNANLLLKNSNTTVGNYGAIYNNNSAGGYTGGIEFINDNQNATASASGDIRFATNNAGTISEKARITSTGNVGIGTPNPQATLDVNGSINISGTGGGITFPNGGGTQTIAYTGVTCGGDYAESVDVTGERTKYEPGDVLVIDPNTPGKFLKSAEPYSTSVTGIYSTKPGTVGRRQTTPKTLDEVPMAMVGIVPTKVSAENGPIKPGDLLVSSSKIGYAMKGTDRSRMLGAVIGKALGSLDSGTGVIEVVVTLQ